MVIPLFVGRPRSIKALELAMESGNNIMLVAQKSAGKDDPTPEDLYDIGCVASILQMLKLPDGTVKEIGRASCRERVLSVRVDLGGRRIIKKKNNDTHNHTKSTTRTTDAH